MSAQLTLTESGISTKLTVSLLIVAVVLQLTVLITLLGQSAYPHYAGQEIRVATTPVDPRSLFRGNYARLNYAFSRLDAAQLGVSEDLLQQQRIGDSVYVVLERSDNGVYVFARASLAQPSQLAVDQIVLHGQFATTHWRDNQRRSVSFGIEAFFAPKDDALRLERELREGGLATLKITRHGRAALIAVGERVDA